MIIRTDLERLNMLSIRLKRLENDLSQITGQLTRTSKITVQSVKYRSSDYQIRRACDNVLDALDKVNRASIRVCDRLHSQSVVIGNSVNSYRQYDRVDRVNKGALYNAGIFLKTFFGFGSVGSYSSKGNYTSRVPEGLSKWLSQWSVSHKYDPEDRLAFVRAEKDDYSVEGNVSWLKGESYKLGGKKVIPVENDTGSEPKKKKSLKDKLAFKIGHKLQGYVGRGELKQVKGITTVVTAAEVFTGYLTGEVKCGLFEDDKFSPGIGAKFEAKGSALKVEEKQRIGDENGYGVYSNASAGVGNANLGVEVGVGKDLFTNEDGTKESGAKAKFAALVSAAEGKVQTGITVAGIDIGIVGTGYLGAYGWEGEAAVTSNGVKLNAGAASVIGGNIGVEIDWNDAEWIDETIDSAVEFAGDVKEKVEDTVEDAKEFAGKAKAEVEKKIEKVQKFAADDFFSDIKETADDFINDTIKNFQN